MIKFFISQIFRNKILIDMKTAKFKNNNEVYIILYGFDRFI